MHSRPSSRAFLLTVDDAGQFLALPATEVTVGHLRGGLAELPLLADVEPRHARFHLRESFRGGSVWWLSAEPGASVTCNGVSLEGERPLHSGDELCFGNVRVDFRLPDPASQTALLELRQGAECAGAQHVLLMAEGDAGRVRIGAARQGHVRVPGLPAERVLTLHAGRLELHPGERPVGQSPLWAQALPLETWGHLPLAESTEQRPPLGLGIGPAPLPRGER